MESSLQLHGVDFSYGSQTVLRDISLSLKGGKFYGILGPNGCGKSTLLDLLCGYRKAESGELFLGGQTYSHYGRAALAREIALVPQEFQLTLGFSVEEIVLMGRHPHIRRFASPSSIDMQAVEWAMAAMGLTSLRDHRASELSGGQKQRTVVARALAQKSSFLLFDEATSNLDIQYSLQIFSLAQQLMADENVTVVAVLHDLHLAAAYCDELILLQDGRIAATGSVEQVMRPELIAEVFGVRTRIGTDLYGQENQPSIHYQLS